MRTGKLQLIRQGIWIGVGFYILRGLIALGTMLIALLFAALLNGCGPEGKVETASWLCMNHGHHCHDPLNGKDGKDGHNGKDGRDGVDGTDGAAGAPGPAGEQGVPGVAGVSGPAGRDGQAGTNGRDGTVGLPGATGPQGVPGPVGPTGSPGTSGAPGADGKDAIINTGSIGVAVAGRQYTTCHHDYSLLSNGWLLLRHQKDGTADQGAGTTGFNTWNIDIQDFTLLSEVGSVVYCTLHYDAHTHHLTGVVNDNSDGHAGDLIDIDLSQPN